MTKMRSMGTRPPRAPSMPPEGAWRARASEGPRIGFMGKIPAGVRLPSGAPLLEGIGRNRQDPHVGSLRRVSASGTAGELRLFRQRTEFDSLPEPGHKVKVEAQVVKRAEHRRRQLAGARQVVEEGPRGAPAGRTAALRIDRQGVVLVAGVLDLERALAGEQHAVAGVA